LPAYIRGAEQARILELESEIKMLQCKVHFLEETVKVYTDMLETSKNNLETLKAMALKDSANSALEAEIAFLHTQIESLKSQLSLSTPGAVKTPQQNTA